MKKLYFFLTVAISLNYLMADEIDDMINKINNKREAKLPKKIIETTPSPMPKLVIKDSNNTKDKKGSKGVIFKNEISFKLKGIMNKSANLNGKWIKIGEEIEGYKLIDIMDDSVYLKDGNKSKIIFFDQNRSKINIKLGR